MDAQNAGTTLDLKLLDGLSDREMDDVFREITEAAEQILEADFAEEPAERLHAKAIAAKIQQMARDTLQEAAARRTEPTPPRPPVVASPPIQSREWAYAYAEADQPQKFDLAALLCGMIAHLASGTLGGLAVAAILLFSSHRVAAASRPTPLTPRPVVVEAVPAPAPAPAPTLAAPAPQRAPQKPALAVPARPHPIVAPRPPPAPEPTVEDDVPPPPDPADAEFEQTFGPPIEATPISEPPKKTVWIPPAPARDAEATGGH